MNSEYRAGLVGKPLSMSGEVRSVDARMLGDAELDEAVELVGDAHLLEPSWVDVSAVAEQASSSYAVRSSVAPLRTTYGDPVYTVAHGEAKRSR